MRGGLSRLTWRTQRLEPLRVCGEPTCGWACDGRETMGLGMTVADVLLFALIVGGFVVAVCRRPWTHAVDSLCSGRLARSRSSGRGRPRHSRLRSATSPSGQWSDWGSWPERCANGRSLQIQPVAPLSPKTLDARNAWREVSGRWTLNPSARRTTLGHTRPDRASHEALHLLRVGGCLSAKPGVPGSGARPRPGCAQICLVGSARGRMHVQPASASWFGVTPSALLGAAATVVNSPHLLLRTPDLSHVRTRRSGAVTFATNAGTTY